MYTGKRVKKDKIHYSIRKLDSYNKKYNFIVSPRILGKSTVMWNKIYKKWKKYGLPALVVRRYEADITDMCEIHGNANIHGESNISNMCEIKDNVEIKGVSDISGVVKISGDCVIDSSDITGTCNIWGIANIIDSDISGCFDIGVNAYIDDVRLNGEASFHEDAYILNR